MKEDSCLSFFLFLELISNNFNCVSALFSQNKSLGKVEGSKQGDRALGRTDAFASQIFFFSSEVWNWWWETEDTNEDGAFSTLFVK